MGTEDFQIRSGGGAGSVRSAHVLRHHLEMMIGGFLSSYSSKPARIGIQETNVAVIGSGAVSFQRTPEIQQADIFRHADAHHLRPELAGNEAVRALAVYRVVCHIEWCAHIIGST